MKLTLFVTATCAALATAAPALKPVHGTNYPGTPRVGKQEWKPESWKTEPTSPPPNGWKKYSEVGPTKRMTGPALTTINGLPVDINLGDELSWPVIRALKPVHGTNYPGSPRVGKQEWKPESWKTEPTSPPPNGWKKYSKVGPTKRMTGPALRKFLEVEVGEGDESVLSERSVDGVYGWSMPDIDPVMMKTPVLPVEKDAGDETKTLELPKGAYHRIRPEKLSEFVALTAAKGNDNKQARNAQSADGPSGGPSIAPAKVAPLTSANNDPAKSNPLTRRILRNFEPITEQAGAKAFQHGGVDCPSWCNSHKDDWRCHVPLPAQCYCYNEQCLSGAKGDPTHFRKHGAKNGVEYTTDQQHPYGFWTKFRESAK